MSFKLYSSALPSITFAFSHSAIKIFGDDYETKDGTCIRDYIHVKDLADAHVKALEYLQENKDKSEIINLGTGMGNSVKEVILAVEKSTNQNINTQIIERRPGDPAVLIADSKKAKVMLGWAPEYGLNDINDHAVKWYKSPKY